ncbi:MAG: GHMP kinase [candidate division KSB1 bacterium]|nr:GHMP kinase [candidate division KSB1 bacterium]
MVITQTPLRVSLAGGGTDLEAFWSMEPGAVTSLAIDKFVYVIVKERFDEKIYINYSRKEIVQSVDEIAHELVREAMRLTGVSGGVEITSLADVPSEGTGLGSSSSVTVGLLNAFYAFQGIQVSADQLARQACDIEIDILGKPIGKQDQYIAAHGGVRFLEFLPDGSVRVERLPVYNEKYRKLGSNLLLFFTGRTRRANQILAKQNENVRDNIVYLREIRNHAYMVRNAIIEGEFDAIGDILHRTWEMKKMLADGISYPEIDEMYECARRAGALGGKICGAGGGGFLLLYCPRAAQDAVRSALHGYRELPFMIESDGSKVIFNYRRYRWK